MKILFSFFITTVFLYANINLAKTTAKIIDAQINIATIDKGSLKEGQSGIVVSKYNKKDSMILTRVVVIESQSNSSTIKFIKDDVLKQDALPTSQLFPSNGDTVVLNHLYNTSLLIAPNNEAKLKVLKKFAAQYFISEDFFASYLKLNKTPLPKQKDIQKFALKNEIGTIFFVVENKIYIVDTVSFKVLYKTEINIESEDIQVPFFSKIQEIEQGFWDFGEKMIKDYNKYYGQLLKEK